VLEEPYGWVVDNTGTKQSGLELTWTLDFEGRGRQGRVRAKVRKFEQPMSERERRLRSRTLPVPPPTMDDEDDEEDDDYEEVDDIDDESSSDGEEEEVSEFIDTPRR
jgi:hypothetical protein